MHPICIWTDENVDRLSEHGVSQDDFEYTIAHAVANVVSRSSGLPAIIGFTEDGRKLLRVYEEIDDDQILPKTACEID